MSHTELSKDIFEMLKKGYEEMSEINLEEANAALSSDNDAVAVCEENLTECE